MNTSRAEARSADDVLDQQPPANRDVYDDMLEDPEVRATVKEELKKLARQGYQGAAQQPQQEAQPDPVQQVRQKVDEHEEWIESFFAKPNDDRDYTEYERRRNEIRKLERKERDLREQQRQQQQAVQNSGQVINSWIERQKATNPKIEKYADQVRKMANQLRPDVLANPQVLTSALEQMIEPRAYKNWREAQERKNREAQTQHQRDVPSGDAYMDEGEDVDTPKDEKYPDATPEEKEFLRGVGLIDDRSGNKKPSGVRHMPNGDVVIPINRGKRNEPRS